MAKIWRNRIIAGTQVYSDCPEKYKEHVKELLLKDVQTGIITQEEYDSLMEK